MPHPALYNNNFSRKLTLRKRDWLLPGMIYYTRGSYEMKENEEETRWGGLSTKRQKISRSFTIRFVLDLIHSSKLASAFQHSYLEIRETKLFIPHTYFLNSAAQPHRIYHQSLRLFYQPRDDQPYQHVVVNVLRQSPFTQSIGLVLCILEWYHTAQKTILQ